jgi:hypothetical protein
VPALPPVPASHRANPAGITPETALAEPGVRVFDFTGRRMKNWIVVDGERLDDDGLARWLRAGVDFTSALPPRWQRAFG